MVAVVTMLVVAACSPNPPPGDASGATTAGATTSSGPSTGAPAVTQPDVRLTAVGGQPSAAPTSSSAVAAPVVGTMPPVVDPSNIYSEAGAGKLSVSVTGAKRYVYVPSPLSGGSGTVDVIDQDTMTVVDHFLAGGVAQHVVPSWDMKTLYVNASAANQLVPIDPLTGKPGKPIPVQRPYNLYFTPDGTRAVVQNEQNNRLDYYDPVTWSKVKSVASTCRGNNHADWSADGSYFLVTCEFSGEMLKVDTRSGDLLSKMSLPKGAMPQDVRLTPSGREFFVADMMNDCVWIVDGGSFTVTGKIATGKGAHGIYPSRDGKVVYVANRGRHMGDEKRRSKPGEGSVSVVDPIANRVVATWAIPNGGSPDMGGLSADGSKLWLSGRYDSEVYVFDTTTGSLVKRIPTSPEPHGLLVWPQPGRYSLGHTGNTR